MARLSDLVDVNLGSDVIRVQNAELPVTFGFDSMEHIAEFYSTDGADGDYAEFEAEMNWLQSNEDVPLNSKSLKIMRALVYGMVRSGGTECSPKELNNSIPLTQVVSIFTVCLEIWRKQNFDGDDLKKSAEPQDHKKKATKKKSPKS